MDGALQEAVGARRGPDVRHVRHEIGAHGVGDGAHARVVVVARVRGRACVVMCQCSGWVTCLLKKSDPHLLAVVVTSPEDHWQG